MTNASCADCGRIVAFRTQDSSEIAECRSCGIWVKRSAEMPGVAVSVKQNGPVAKKTALPPRKDEVTSVPRNPVVNTQRSAATRPDDLVETIYAGGANGNQHGGSITAASVYAAVRDLQKSVRDLRAGQKRLIADQKTLQTDQQVLKDGQDTLHGGQQQLFKQYQEVQNGQNRLFDRLQSLPALPVGETTTPTAEPTSLAVSPLEALEQGTPAQVGFCTTPFSSLKIPLIPFRLEDLDIEPQFTEQGSVPGIPAHERTDRVSLIENPLPEPPPYTAPAETHPKVDPAGEAPPGEEEDPFAETPGENHFAEPTEADPFLSDIAHESPFKVEGPPEKPFSIAGEETAAAPSTPIETAPPANQAGFGSSLFRATPLPFGTKEYTHEPHEIDNPFSDANAGKPAPAEPGAETELETPDNVETSEAFSETPVEKDVFAEEIFPQSLSEQIADAKESQERNPYEEDSSSEDLMEASDTTRKFPFLGFLLLLLAAAAAALFFFTDFFKKEQTTPPDKEAILLELPPRGIILSEADEQVSEAEKIAQAFLAAKTQDEVKKTVLPVHSSLLKNFWEPLKAPTIERFFQGRLLENDRVEVDFIIKDFGRKERLLSLIKVGALPFRVDWKSYRECEEVTLDGLAQGPLLLDNGATIEQGKIRTWIQNDKQIGAKLKLGNFAGFKLHDFSEKVEAFAVVRKESPHFGRLLEALANTKIKHKGKPAIQAILEVKHIAGEDSANGKPARLEILDVIATDWRNTKAKKANEHSPAQSVKPTRPEQQRPKTTPVTPDPVQSNQQQERSEQLPPVPSEGDPLALHREHVKELQRLRIRPRETPVLEVNFE